MSLKNSSVILTYNVGGMQTSYGRYDYRERTTSGSILEEDQRFIIKKEPEYSDCYKRINLSEAFVNHAISDEGRPERHGNYKAYTFWRKMSQTQRLAFHIDRYVKSMGGSNYTYDILEE